MNNINKKALWVGFCLIIINKSYAYDSSHFIWSKMVDAPADSVEILNYLIKVNKIDYRSIKLTPEQRYTLKSMANVDHATNSLKLIPEVLKHLDSLNPKIKKLTPIFAQYYRIHDFIYGKLNKNLYIDTAQEIKKFDNNCYIYPIMASLIGNILIDDYDSRLDSTIVDLLQLKKIQHGLMLLATVSSCLEKEDTLRLIEKFRSGNNLSNEDVETLERMIHNINKQDEIPEFPFIIIWYFPYPGWEKSETKSLFPFPTILPKTRATMILD